MEFPVSHKATAVERIRHILRLGCIQVRSINGIDVIPSIDIIHVKGEPVLDVLGPNALINKLDYAYAVKALLAVRIVVPRHIFRLVVGIVVLEVPEYRIDLVALERVAHLGDGFCRPLVELQR